MNSHFVATAVATAFLTVFPFKNRSGTTSYRVAGTLPTGRVRKNFATEVEAQAWANKHTPRVSANQPKPVITAASEHQVRQFEAALLRLPAGTDVVQAVDFFAEFHRPLKPAPIAEAIAAFGDWLETQRKCEPNTIAMRKYVLGRFAREQKITRSDRITTAAAEAWIYDKDVAIRTQRDRYDILNWFCEFLSKKTRKLAAVNPVAELDRPVVKVDVPGVLTFDETWILLQCALTDAEGPDMLPFFAICCLSGVRPDEVPRLGSVKPNGEKTNGWEDIYLDEEHRLIEVNKAKGGRSRRNVHISDPLWRILTWCKGKKLAVNFFSKRKFNRIRRRAGLLDRWEKDLLRHTYASHHYIVHKDIKFLEADMANSERVLFQNYLRPVPRVDGYRFEGLILHYSAPRERSLMGAGPKPRKKSA